MRDGGALALPEIAQKLGIEAKDVGSAFGGLSKDKVLVMDGEKRATLAPGGKEIAGRAAGRAAVAPDPGGKRARWTRPR